MQGRAIEVVGWQAPQPSQPAIEGVTFLVTGNPI